jgi:hypothetical protein
MAPWKKKHTESILGLKDFILGKDALVMSYEWKIVNCSRLCL